jgi:hypothetical protein
VSDSLSDRFIPRERETVIHCTISWVGPKVGPCVMSKRNIPFSARSRISRPYEEKFLLLTLPSYSIASLQ